MAKMGRYCKAYALADLRRFNGWSEMAQNARPDASDGSGGETLAPRALTDDAYVYLHDDFSVTDGIFLDEHVLYDGRTAEWKTYCTETLGFAPPDGAPAPPAEGSGS
jgi:hypothetical protein